MKEEIGEGERGSSERRREYASERTDLNLVLALPSQRIVNSSTPVQSGSGKNREPMRPDRSRWVKERKQLDQEGEAMELWDRVYEANKLSCETDRERSSTARPKGEERKRWARGYEANSFNSETKGRGVKPTDRWMASQFISYAFPCLQLKKVNEFTEWKKEKGRRRETKGRDRRERVEGSSSSHTAYMNYLVQEWNQSGSLIDSLWLPFSERQWISYAFPRSIINRKRRMNKESLFTSQRVSERINRWRESTFISYWTNHMNLFPLVTGQAGRVHSSFGPCSMTPKRRGMRFGNSFG